MSSDAMGLATGLPDIRLSVRDFFGIDSDMQVPGFSAATEHVPEIDPTYRFDHDTTLAVLAGFAFNRRVIVQGYHGTGKSTHIEQVAARLKWPCVRINLDSHISRIDLVGKDAIVLRDGHQVTEFREGILPWALQSPCALVFDEYDAGRPDVMFVIQRILEKEGKMTLLDQNRVIHPHKSFRLFATANTIGLGDTTGLYHGTQQINQGQMDRWNVVTTLNYLPHEAEVEIVMAKMAHDGVDPSGRRDQVEAMVRLAHLTRSGVHCRRYFHRHVAAHSHELGGKPGDLWRRCFCLPGHFPQQMRRTGAPGRGRVLPALLRPGVERVPGARAPGSMTGASTDSPVGIFKRATAAALRAMAEQGDIEVQFSSEPAGVNGKRARLPHPPGDLDPRELAIVRGNADAAALRLRHHDRAIHLRRMPVEETARAAFEALEQARVEALGARAMPGVAANLGAAMEDKFHRQGYEALTRREDVPMHEVLRLLAREAMTGAAPPESSQGALSLWRPMIEEKIAADLGKLAGVAGDQDAYAAEVRRILSHLDMSLNEDFEPEPDDLEDDDLSEAAENSDAEAEGGDEDQGASAASEAGTEDADQTADPGMEEMAMQPSADEMGEELPTNEVRRSDADSGAANPSAYRNLYHAVRRSDRRGGPLRHRGTDAAACVAGSSAWVPARRHCAVGEPASAQASGATNALVEFRSGGGFAGTPRGWRG